MTFIKNLLLVLFTRSIQTKPKVHIPKIVEAKKEPKVETNDILIKTPVFYLGSLEVYQLQTPNELQAGIFKGVYWADKASPQGYGPFLSLFKCMEHYSWVASGKEPRNKLLPAMEKKPIRVDFQAKKVIDTPER